ncbi:hypothetical protein [Cecembia sp.]|uniref:hypothetical protein n=1 Tax=Cecembia sp. TaxID=1898110 RepID=UPI0025BC4194|nr:hypothetical protein [Cecembia sp.]
MKSSTEVTFKNTGTVIFSLITIQAVIYLFWVKPKELAISKEYRTNISLMPLAETPKLENRRYVLAACSGIFTYISQKYTI